MSELIFGSSDKKQNYKISRLVRDGRILKIAPRIYSENLTDEPSDIVRRNILEIIANLYPGSVLSHRSAFEIRPTETNQIFITHSYTKKINLPGITINFIKGRGKLPGDTLLFGKLVVSSKERAILENLQVAKRSGESSKTLSKKMIEEKLNDIMLVNGKPGLESLLQKCGSLSSELGMSWEYDLLKRMVRNISNLKPARIIKSGVAISNVSGSPFDRDSAELFESLFSYLHNKEFNVYPVKSGSPETFRNIALFEAYFSNRLDGNPLELIDAKSVIEQGVPVPEHRIASFELRSTHQLVSDPDELALVPPDPDEFINLLQSRHKILNYINQSTMPGLFREENVFEENPYAVDYRLIRGTLKRGFEYYTALNNTFAKAVFINFIISHVHPFVSGNGRIARVMMSSELVNMGESKILITPVLFNEYLSSIKTLSSVGEERPYINLLSKSHMFTHRLHFSEYDDLLEYLKSHNAFANPDTGKRLIVE